MRSCCAWLEVTPDPDDWPDALETIWPIVFCALELEFEECEDESLDAALLLDAAAGVVGVLEARGAGLRALLARRRTARVRHGALGSVGSGSLTPGWLGPSHE